MRKVDAKERLEIFKEELECIINPQIEKYAEESLKLLPDYFFVVAGSSTGKYHPVFALGDGGLVRHVKACIRIAVELYRMEMFDHFTEEVKDLMLVALLLHDGTKRGFDKENPPHTVYNHPLVAVEFLKSKEELKNILYSYQEELIYSFIGSHMGQWNKDNEGNEILPKPKNKMESFVHLVDYLASRKIIEINFDAKVERQ